MYRSFLSRFLLSHRSAMPKKTPHYAPDVQRRAVDQVLRQHLPIAQVAQHLHCSPQSVRNWIDKHHQSLSISSTVPLVSSSSPSPLAFLPIQVEHPTSPSAKIELVTRTGLVLRFPVETPSDTLCNIVRQLDIWFAGFVEKVGDGDERVVECAAAWIERVGVFGGRVVSFERLESASGLAGKSFAGSLGEVGNAADGSGGSCSGTIGIPLAFSRRATFFSPIGKNPPTLNTPFVIFRKIRQETHNGLL